MSNCLHYPCGYEVTHNYEEELYCKKHYFKKIASYAFHEINYFNAHNYFKNIKIIIKYLIYSCKIKFY